jgi:opacity protein-like surface antigen
MKKILTLLTTIVLASSFMYAIDWTSTTSPAEVAEMQATISSGFDTFSEDLAESLSNSATLQNVWADAYIGKLFPSLVPHFGAGINVGAVSLDSSGFESVANELGMGSYVPSSLAIPVINAEAKIGGIILPFDLGVSIMKFDSSNLADLNISSLDNMDFDYFSFGVDFRYNIIKQNLVLPNVSVGALYNYTSGSFSVESDDASAEINYKSQTYGLQAQVSKNFIGIITPFGGGRLLVATADNDWNYSEDTGITNVATINTLQTAGYTINDDGTISGSGSYTYSLVDYDSLDDLNMQVFAGVGINLLVVQFTPSVSYDFTQGIWGATFSTHIKL